MVIIHAVGIDVAVATILEPTALLYQGVVVRLHRGHEAAEHLEHVGFR